MKQKVFGKFLLKIVCKGEPKEVKTRKPRGRVALIDPAGTGRRVRREPIDKTKKLGTLICLNDYGKGEAIRMMLWYSGLDYDVVEVTPEQVQ